MTSEQHVHEEVEGATSAGTDSAWMRRHFSDSIYIWACGEKAHEEDEHPTMSDRLIGWVILFMQGFAYTMLTILARETSNTYTSSSHDERKDTGYLLPSVTGAMYLLIASTTHDLRAGFSLLVNGKCAGHRAFGIGLLGVYGILISAAMTVLVSTSEDRASVVLNAVTVLFVADLDEQTLKFFVAVPHKWRLFWAMESIAISFALALVAIAYMGDASPLLEESKDIIRNLVPTWGFWVVGPAAVTWGSFRLSEALKTVCEFFEEGENAADIATNFVLTKFFVCLREIVKGTRERLRAELLFHVCRFSWLTQAVGSFWFSDVVGFPVALVYSSIPSAGDEYSLVVTPKKYTLVTVNAVLAIGLAIKLLKFILSRYERLAEILEQRYFSESEGSAEIRRNCPDSRVPSLLVGWGIGYWVTSLLYLMARSPYESGWGHVPTVLSAIFYVIVQCFLLAGVFVLADINFLGNAIDTFVKPAVVMMKDRRLVVYWILATVLRDAVMGWTKLCLAMTIFLHL